MTTSLLTGPVLVFDGDCAFCTSSVSWLQERLPGACTAVPYQRTDLAPLGLTEAECHARLQWVGDIDDVVTSRRQGARAVGSLLRTGGRRRGGVEGTAWRCLGALAFVPPTSWVAAGIYHLVAANRQRLPGGTPACAL